MTTVNEKRRDGGEHEAIYSAIAVVVFSVHVYSGTPVFDADGGTTVFLGKSPQFKK